MVYIFIYLHNDYDTITWKVKFHNLVLDKKKKEEKRGPPFDMVYCGVQYRGLAFLSYQASSTYQVSKQKHMLFKLTMHCKFQG